MRTMLLSAAAAALALTAAPAGAMIFSFGNSLAAACYKSSLANTATRFALQECSRSLDEEPLSFEDRVATFVNRGIVKMNLGDYPAAEKDFNTAIAMDQGEAEAWLNKALLRLRQERPGEALPFVEQALTAKTERPALALYARGIANEQLGNLRAAYADLLKARELDPGWALPGQQLARYRVRR